MSRHSFSAATPLAINLIRRKSQVSASCDSSSCFDGRIQSDTFSFLLCLSICPSTKTREAKKLIQSLLRPYHPPPPPRYCRYPSTAVAATLLSMQAPSCDGEGRKLLVGFPVTCFQKHKTPAGEKRILSVFARAEIKVKGLCVLRIKGKNGTSKAFLKWMNLDFDVSLRKKKCISSSPPLFFF